MIGLIFEGVSWNCSSVVSKGTTERQFIEDGLGNQYRDYSESVQRKLLKEAYRLIKLKTIKT